MEGKNNNNEIIAILIVIIVLMAVFICLLITGTINIGNKNNQTDTSIINNCIDDNQNIVNNYSNLEGLYEFKSETFKDELGNEFTAYLSLYLYKDGTFVYERTQAISNKLFGNYTVENNKVYLNVLFETGSDFGAYVKEKEELLPIDISSNDILIDNLYSIEELNLNSITLKKATTEEANKFASDTRNYSLLEVLNNHECINSFYKNKIQNARED